MPAISLTLEQIQGRLNQREIRWLAAQSSPDAPKVTFTPKDDRGVSVEWDRGHPAVRSLDDVVQFLTSYR